MTRLHWLKVAWRRLVLLCVIPIALVVWAFWAVILSLGEAAEMWEEAKKP